MTFSPLHRMSMNHPHRPPRPLRGLALAVLGLAGLAACSGGDEPQPTPPPAQKPAEAIPVPVPLPLTFPVAIEVATFDQRNAYENPDFNLAFVDHYTILARDEVTGDFGVATVSNMPAIGALLPAARAGTGAVMIAAAANTAWKDQALDLLAQGKDADEVIAAVAPELDSQNAGRQIAVIDRDGRSAVMIGDRVPGGDYRTYWRSRPNCVAVACQIDAQSPKVIAMLDAYEASKGEPLPERLLKALRAAWNTVPPETEVHLAKQFQSGKPASAALLVVREGGGYDHRSDRLVDLRVDLSANPLPRLVEAYKAWCVGVVGPRLKSTLQKLEPGSPAYELNREWQARSRRGIELK